MDKNRLDALFSGLTRAKDSEDKQQTEQESTDNVPATIPTKAKVGKARARQKKYESEKQEERFCTIVKTEQIKKLRIIAKREGLQIKDVVEAAFGKAITAYERKHGKIEETPRKNIKALFETAKTTRYKIFGTTFS